MRTTLTIDDDVLSAVRARAERERKTVGEVISALARKGLAQDTRRGATRHGVPLLARRRGAQLVTPKLVKQLSEESP